MTRAALKWAVAGLAMALLLTPLSYFDLVPEVVLVILWPSSFGLMAIQHPHGIAWLVLLYSALIIHNAFLYGMIGLVLAYLRHLVRRMAGVARPEQKPGGIVRVAVGFASAGFAIACILCVVANYTAVLPGPVYRVLAPVNAFDASRNDSVPQLLLEAVFYGPANAAVYFVLGLVTGSIWRFLKGTGPGGGEQHPGVVNPSGAGPAGAHR